MRERGRAHRRGAHLGVEFTQRYHRRTAAPDRCWHYLRGLEEGEGKGESGVVSLPCLPPPCLIARPARGTAKAAASTDWRAEVPLPRLVIRPCPAELGGVGRAEREAPALLGRVAPGEACSGRVGEARPNCELERPWVSCFHSWDPLILSVGLGSGGGTITSRISTRSVKALQYCACTCRCVRSTCGGA